MKTLFLSIIGICSFLTITAQDLIITNEQDSIFCNILGIKSKVIYYKLNTQAGSPIKELPMDKVAAIEENYSARQTKNANEATIPVNYQPTFYSFAINAHVGYARRLAPLPDNISPDLKNYLKPLKQGFQFGVGFMYRFNKEHGLRFNYSSFSTATTPTAIIVADSAGNTLPGEIHDDVTINTFSLNYVSTKELYKAFKALHISIGVGYGSYKNNSYFFDTAYLIESNTVVVELGIAADYFLTENLFLTPSVDLDLGSLTELKVTNLSNNRINRIKFEAENAESITRIDFSLGLSYRF